MRGLDYLQVVSKENKYQYNGGAEKNTDFGLNLYETDYRLYDPLAPHFLQIDPKAEDGGQESWSPYHYSFNNPIRYNDPKGDCPQCWGALIGAGVEIAGQLAVNYATELVKAGGDNSKVDWQAVRNLDWADVGIAAVEGGLTAGIGASKRFISAGDKVTKAFQTLSVGTGAVATGVVDAKVDGGLTYLGGKGDNKKSLDVVLLESAGGAFVATKAFKYGEKYANKGTQRMQKKLSEKTKELNEGEFPNSASQPQRNSITTTIENLQQDIGAAKAYINTTISLVGSTISKAASTAYQETKKWLGF